MDCDWESEEETEPEVISLHIPINAEAKKEYAEWVKKDCDEDWWYYKETAKKKEVHQNT